MNGGSNDYKNQVTCENFEATLPMVEEALNGADFVAVDLEMTGN